MSVLFARHLRSTLKQGQALSRRVLSNSFSSTETFKYEDLEINLSQNLKPKPDPNKLVFGKEFSDHMLTIQWNEAQGGWAAPQIQQFGNLSLHPAASSLHYALELFEGMKAYRGVDEKIRLFRPMANMDRMHVSAHRCALPSYNKEELLKCISKLVSVDKEWVPHSTSSTLYIRPTYISTEPTLGVASPGQALLYVLLCPVGPYFATGMKPVSLYADTENVRAWQGGVGYAKLGCNYGPTIMPQRAAAEKGCQQVLWLYGDDHYLTEVGTMNIFISWQNEAGEKELITPPLDGTILPGVTRKSLLDLAREWKEFKVTERVLSMKEFTKALSENRVHEMFGAGTACVVCPVNKILYKGDWMDIPCSFDDNSLTKRFYTQLTDIQFGRTQSDWTVEVD